MKSGPLVSVLFAVGAACDLLLEENEVVKKYVASLQRHVIIDWANPPTADASSVSESTSWPWTLMCNPTYFKIQKQLAKLQVSHSDSRFRFSMPKATVYFTQYVEDGIINIGDDDITFSAERSTTNIDSTTDGWQIGAQLSTGLKGITVSAGYSQTSTAGTSKSKGVSFDTICKPGYDCRIETWTFHLRLSGHCKLRPIINCAGEVDACQFNWSPRSPQFEAYQLKHCYFENPARTYHYEACQVQTPILHQTGWPFTRLVRISERISGEEDEEKGPKALKEDDGWYELENGEWYDPEDDTYYGMRGEKWYTKPGAPRPDLSNLTKIAPSASKEAGSGPLTKAAGKVTKRWNAKSPAAGKREIEVVFLDEVTI